MTGRPWEIQGKEPGKYLPCDRLGCETNGLRIGTIDPHTGKSFWVCRPCSWARKMWDKMNVDQQSNTWQTRVYEN